MNSDLRSLAQMALMAALTAVGAFLRIPLPWIPVTLQLTCVCLAGIWLGARRGAASQIVYLLTGLLGFPVFAQGGGPQYLLEPTFGYLLAFPAAAAITGSCPSGCGMLRLLTLTASAIAVVYLTGSCWFYLDLRYLLHVEMGLTRALQIGFAPLPKDLLLTLPACAAAFRVSSVSRRLRRCSDT